jgi:hypothetical protein
MVKPLFAMLVLYVVHDVIAVQVERSQREVQEARWSAASSPAQAPALRCKRNNLQQSGRD